MRLPVRTRPATSRRIARRRWSLLVVLAGRGVVVDASASAAAADGGYRTAPVERGDIRVAISATGTLSAISTVDVGSQISGQVTDVLVDFNDRVSEGQVHRAHRSEHLPGADRAGRGRRSPARAPTSPPRRRRCATPKPTTRARPRWRSSSWSRAATPTSPAPRATRRARRSTRRRRRSPSSRRRRRPRGSTCSAP